MVDRPFGSGVYLLRRDVTASPTGTRETRFSPMRQDSDDPAGAPAGRCVSICGGAANGTCAERLGLRYDRWARVFADQRCRAGPGKEFAGNRASGGPVLRRFAVTLCPSCSAMTTDDARFCQNCGRALAVSRTTADRPSVKADSFTAFLRSTTPETRILGGCTLVVFVALLLPWYSVTVLGFSASVNGFHSWGWLTFLGLLVAVASTVTLARAGQGTSGSAGHERQEPLLVLTAGLAETIGAIGFLVDIETSSGGLGSPSAGLYLALLAGLCTSAVGAWPLFVNQRRIRRPPQ
jgi:hypothetical protein